MENVELRPGIESWRWAVKYTFIMYLVKYASFSFSILPFLEKSDPGPVRNFRHEIRQNEDFIDEYTLLLEWDTPNYNCE